MIKTRAINTAGSHKPVLEYILLNMNIKYILELGMGYNSTPLFLGSSPCSLISVENNKEWIDEIYDSNNLNHCVIHCTDSKYHLYPEKLSGMDLIFIDASPPTHRGYAVNNSFRRAKIIVAHDTQQIEPDVYNWKQVKVPDNYLVFIYKKCRPWTTVWIMKHLVQENFYEFFR